jgi:hypothetical protein
MPAECELDYTNRLVRTRGWDHVTAGDLFALASRIRQLFAEGTIDAGWREFVDFREVTRTELVPAEAVRQLARENPWPSTARRVILAPVAVVFGVSRMYQLLAASGHEEIAVVRTEAEALGFLAASLHSNDPSSDSKID